MQTPSGAVRRSKGAGWLPGGLLAVLIVLFLLGAMGYRAGPPPGHTGGFGEPTCHRCHFERPLNAPSGSLTVEDVPESYQPAQVYPITIRLMREELERGGFQLSARFLDSNRAGNQAGRFQIRGDRVTLASADSGRVRFAQHTDSGTRPRQSREIEWTIRWKAPSDPSDSVVFHVAANAANGDNSEFGDYIYTHRVVSHETSSPP